MWMSFQHSSKKMTSMLPKRCLAKGGNCNGIVSNIWWSFKLASIHHQVRILFCKAPGEVDSPLKTRKKCQSWVGILRCNKSPNGEASLDRLRQVISALHFIPHTTQHVQVIVFVGMFKFLSISPTLIKYPLNQGLGYQIDINTKTRSRTFLPHVFLGDEFFGPVSIE